MKLHNNITIFTGDTQNPAQAGKTGAGQSARTTQGKNKTIYAGNLLTEFPLQDRIQKRRAQAQERAMKIVGDAWDADRQIDDEIRQRRDHIRELQEDNKDALENLKEFREMEDTLREGYGVTSDSREQQDLELLKKAQAEKHRWAGIELTPEENARLNEINQKELTEYQKIQLELNEDIWTYKDTVYTSGRAIEKENAVIRGIRLERLKKDPMVKAQQQAENVMESARKEAIGMIVEEAKDHLDEEQEEKEEEAEAVKEKKEEQEEILEKRKDREDVLEELTEDMPLQEMSDLKNVQTEIQQEIQNLVSKMSLVEEDIKGAKVDTNV